MGKRDGTYKKKKIHFFTQWIIEQYIIFNLIYKAQNIYIVAHASDFLLWNFQTVG